MGNTDFLSRCPLSAASDPVSIDDVLMIELAATPIVSDESIAAQTSKDPLLAKVSNWVLRGWPDMKLEQSDNAYPYFCRREQLSTNRGVLIWGNRAVVPPKSRETIVAALHAAHPGIVKIKALARSYVWWPNIDAEIELIVKKCIPCKQNRNYHSEAPVHHWESAKRPWSRVHIDFTGPFQGKTFFLVVDFYSKWLEVAVVSSTSTAATIKVLRQLFATHGLPDQLVSDNGTAFTSEEFKSFLHNNLIRHIRSALFQPTTNGQAERMVQTTKNYLKVLL
ncbi:uncharacterized protein K02A2.6-like [Drosophila willistoni]|uniref:uncharacterized protein K02A2.6-like n=1 Tax=Drosophila willistoni TaxID=7260 RepID=UPI001F085719|nr:uncharacterized protein K02A2.6-like [Drosophila willistoni]